MSKPTSRHRMRMALLIALGIFLLLTYGAALAFYSSTAIEPIWPAAIGLAFAAATAIPCSRLWQKLLRTDSRICRMAAHFIAASGIGAFLFLGVNFLGADTSSSRKERVALVSRHSELHYRQHRVGRNRYVRGEPYSQYYMTVRFSNGHKKRLSVTHKQFNSLARRDSVTLRMERGMLGWPVIRRSGKSIEVPPVRR